MLRTLGADAAGMSTVHEAIQARSLGLEVAAFSCLTNWAAALSSAKLVHEAVLAVVQDSGDFLLNELSHRYHMRLVVVAYAGDCSGRCLSRTHCWEWNYFYGLESNFQGIKELPKILYRQNE
ncbi:MAG: hypothetical protein ACR2G0_13135 [Chthoniobacterales bacterium]